MHDVRSIPHPGDIRHSQIPMGCPTHPPPPLGLDIDRCITEVNILQVRVCHTFAISTCPIILFVLGGNQ